MKYRLVLASQSPRRKELLGHLGIPFEILSKNIPEISHKLSPNEYCIDLAMQKGQAVAQELPFNQNWMVVSADTIVVLGEKIYGKPADRNEARQILSELSGKDHEVYTGVGIIIMEQGQLKEHSFAERTKVRFNSITDDIMERYLATNDSLDKAGAYGIQGPSLTFISRIEGDYANVVGFPLSRFVLECTQIFGKDIWQRFSS